MGVENGLLRDSTRALILNMRTGAVPLSQTRLGLALDSSQAVIAGAAPASPGATDKVRNGILLTLDNCPYFTFTEPSTKRFSNDVVTDANGSIWGTSSPSGGTRWTYNMLLGDVLIDGRGAVVVNTPAAESNNAAWYRYGIGLTDAGAGACSAWADQSGNGRDLTAAGGARPTIQADKSLLFDGVANVMKVSFTYAQPLTQYFLLSQVSWTNNLIITDGAGAGGAPQRLQFAQSTASPNIKATDGVGNTANLSLTIGSYGVLCLLANGASSGASLNNGALQTATFSAGTDPNGITIGANRGSAGFSNVQFKEIILFSAAHDAATRARVITYLKHIGAL